MAEIPMMFRGASTHSLDDKSRLNVPKRFKDTLMEGSAEFVLTASPDGCLLLTTTDQLASWAEELGGGSPADESDRRNKRRALLGHAETVRPDSAGRLLLPEMSRSWIGLDANRKEVVLVGTGEAIEIWSGDGWAERRKAILSSSFQHDEVESKAG
ncbi:MAG: cell division/cell wall cluster transcriptional repressor MraZ [Planctomycetota bacterium]